MSNRIQRVRHEIKRRELQVAKVQHLAPDYVSVTFKGETLHDFVSASYDDHVKFMLSDDDRRDFTPRSYDNVAGELTIEFALHATGAASDWARQAAVGQTAVIAGPRGSMIIPMDYDWYVLTGDATALPAIRRRLEELPREAKVTVLVAAESAVSLPFRSEAQMALQLLDSQEALLAAIRALQLPAGDGFFWFAGEASVAAQVRDAVFVDKGHPREAARISAYWKQGASGHHEDL
ncbi:siderophore-interacting protein [Duganella dendranthematis]|jgi:NADPH-dependent ferric siderophore reductase|uniref:Siderophore-interacting protein n=1 Tax=Duganella dendranthematis TaxID=2728021 RepID=A0ABX6MHT2_9BURK|nr:siderophore-interacting protein [Duganella dendranthematis]QJD93878.1 siderophore-interacting protein [Duganella dendranthematis]